MMAYFSSLFCVSDSIVVAAAKQCIAMLVVSSSSMAWNLGALQRVWAILFCLPFAHSMVKLYSASFSLILRILVLSTSCIFHWKRPCSGLYVDLTSNVSMPCS